MTNQWWKDTPMRVIQTNLQMLDTPKMDPEKIARETEEMGGNVLVINGDATDMEGYLCGSPGMIGACVKLLTEKGMRRDCIYYDRF